MIPIHVVLVVVHGVIPNALSIVVNIVLAVVAVAVSGMKCSSGGVCGGGSSSSSSMGTDWECHVIHGKQVIFCVALPCVQSYFKNRLPYQINSSACFVWRGHAYSTPS
jgi:hypothetical protein